MTEGEAPPLKEGDVLPKEGDVLLLARETEQLERIAERLRKGRRVVAFIACDGDLRPKVAEWLSKASGREVAVPAEEDPEQLLARLEALAGREGVESLAWKAGDRRALVTLNLHREKLRRGGGVLVWCSLGDLALVQTEARDAFSFRDTLVVVEGFRLPKIRFPVGDTPEIELARARYELPGTPMERALAAAELARLLLERRRPQDALDAVSTAIPLILGYRQENAAMGMLGFLQAVMAASYAMSHRPTSAWGRAQSAAIALEAQGVNGATYYALQVHPASDVAVEASFALVDLAADAPLERTDLRMARVDAAVAYKLGSTRVFLPHIKDACASAGVQHGLDVAGVLLSLATGEVHEAIRLAVELLERGDSEAWDGRGSALYLGRALFLAGELEATLCLMAGLGSIVSSTDWAIDVSTLMACALSMVTEPKITLGRFEKIIANAPTDGALFRALRAYVCVLSAFALAGHLNEQELLAAESVVESSQLLLPDNPDLAPPFYEILIPGLRSDLFSIIPERRLQAIDLSRAALELARLEYPPYAPPHAEKLVRCLFFARRLDEAKRALSEAEPEAKYQGHLRALSALQALRVAIHIAAGDPAADIDTALSALNETLAATGSPRLAAETLLSLARMLPPDCTHPDPLKLVEAQAERFAEMPMVANEELCRETRGDILLARGFRAEAAACFAAAKKRLQHYGLLLRVPLLEKKRASAEQSPP
jgi:hypothetical protein